MFRSILAVLLALGAPLAAQETRKITLRTLCFTHVNDVKKLYLPGEEAGALVEVPLFTEVFSLPVTATAAWATAVAERPHTRLLAVVVRDTQGLLYERNNE